MYPVSTAFLAAVRQSHTIARRLDVCSVDGSVLQTIQATGGDVTVDRRRTGRRECSFTIPDITGTLTPAVGSDLLSPLAGHELRPYGGVTYPDGTTELVPLGVFPIRRAPSSTSNGASIIAVAGKDRSSTVARNRWTSPLTIPSGTALEEAIAQILTDRAPAFPQNLPATGYSLAKDYTFGLEPDSDPWADAQQIATDAGWELFYDVTGTATMAQPLDPTTAVPIIAYADDAASVTESAGKDWDTEKAFNGYIVIGENSGGAPVRAEVWDDDPQSPTYYLGDYGPYPDFIVSSKISTADQALAAGQAALAKLRGVAQTVTWNQIVNPAHDVDDAIAFSHSDLRIAASTTVLLDSLTIPWLPSQTMSAEARSRQVLT